MERNPQLRVAEAGALVFTLVVTKAFLDFPSVVARVGQSAAWIGVLAAMLVAVAGTLFYAVLLERWPGRGVAEIALEVAGPVLGSALGLALAIWVLLLCSVTLRMFAENFITVVLPRTPPSAIMLITLLAVVMAAQRGIAALARANLFLIPMMSLALLAFLIMLYPQIRTDWLFPIWGPGPAALARQGVLQAGYFGEIALLGIFGYALRGRRDFRRGGLSGLVTAALSLAVLVAGYVAVFGPLAAAKQPFPFFAMARMIYLGRFIQRLESAYVLFWGVAAAIFLSTALHAAATATAQSLGLPFHRPLLIPLAVLTYAIAMVPDQFTQAADWSQWLRGAGGVIALGLPLGLLILAPLRRRRPADANQT